MLQLLLLSFTFLRITKRTNSADVTFVGYNVKARTVTMHVIADWQYFIYVKYAGNISDSREWVWPWHCVCSWGFLYLRASLMVKTYKSCHKHKHLPQHLSLCTGRHLLCVQFIRSLKSKLYTDLTKQNATGSKSIQSHAEETNEIQLCILNWNTSVTVQTANSLTLPPLMWKPLPRSKSILWVPHSMSMTDIRAYLHWFIAFRHQTGN